MLFLKKKHEKNYDLFDFYPDIINRIWAEEI
jgi:hypothetical protein